MSGHLLVIRMSLSLLMLEIVKRSMRPKMTMMVECADIYEFTTATDMKIDKMGDELMRTEVNISVVPATEVPLEGAPRVLLVLLLTLHVQANIRWEVTPGQLPLLPSSTRHIEAPVHTTASNVWS
ncbi:hypothetical protein Plhal304r1_c028g0092931 [Plasmopara halstedii]